MSTAPSTPAPDANLSALGRELLDTGSSKPPSGPWVPPTAEELGKLLQEYDIVKMLGRGGMGAVYMGRQKSLERPVAIKILSNTLDEADASFAERFKNEARAMGKLNHPGVVAVYDFGETAGGLLYIVMEYVDGTDVSRMIAKDGRLRTEHAMAITAHVCDALAYAHERGIIHRDIKPANIMVAYDGSVKVADFGLAKMTHSQNSGLTQSGMAMGTLHYMAPEALMLGTAVDHRADIYAVGVMLYQMLTGKIPQGVFKLPSRLIPGLDPRYDGIIAKAVMEDREARYQSVGEMRRDLDGILTQPVLKVGLEVSQATAALPGQKPQAHSGGHSYQPEQKEHLSPLRPGTLLLWGSALVLAAGMVWVLSQRGELPPENGTVAKSAVGAESTHFATASMERPFVNSLGMRFVPVPGTAALFSIWDTRVQDYEQYASQAQVRMAKSRHLQGPTHPVVEVQWEHAKAFCAWLTTKERGEKVISSAQEYRLPTDAEWSVAVGLPAEVGNTPAAKSGKIKDLYPWGTGWPPPQGAGNYLGEGETEEGYEKKYNFKPQEIQGYRDGFNSTSPVGSFAANKFGLYDMGGNVSQFVEDWFDEKQDARTLRGNCWFSSLSPQERSLSSYRYRHQKDYAANSAWGFRCVLASVLAASSSPTPTPPPMPVGSPATVATTPATPATPAPSTPAIALPLPATPPFDLQQLPDFRTRVANYQKARHAQLSDLATKYRAALATEKDMAIKSGMLANVTACDVALASITTLTQLIEANLTATEIKPLPALAAANEPSPQRLKELRDIIVREIAKIETSLVASLDQSLATVQVSLTTAKNLAAAKAVEIYRQQIKTAFVTADGGRSSAVVSSAAIKAVPSRAGIAAAGDWPQWRGPNRDDVSTETGLLKQWPAAGPKSLWVNSDAGLGYSGFAIVGNKLYTMGLYDAEEMLICLDAATGTKIWETTVGAVYKNGWGDGPRCTPTVADGMVYALGGNGDLMCADATTGKKIWNTSLTKDLGGKLQGWGYTESPLVDAGLVLITPGGVNGAIAALNAKTGKVVWQTSSVKENAQYSSIIPLDLNGQRQYAQLLMTTLVGFSGDGKVLWQTPFPGKTAVIPTPIFKNDTVYVAAGYNAGCKAIKLGGITPVEVYANTNMVNHHGGVILFDDCLYGHSDRGGWTCQDFKTGAIIWQDRGIGKGAVACADGMLYCLGENDGTIALVPAAKNGWNMVSSFKLQATSSQRNPKGKIWTHPVIAGGKLYLRDQEFISCYDLKN